MEGDTETDGKAKQLDPNGTRLQRTNRALLPPSTASDLGWKETLVDSGVRFLEKR